MNRFFRTELLRSLTSSRIALAVLLLSFLGPALATLLRSSVDTFLRENSRRLLTADLAISADRAIRDEEVARLERLAPVARRLRETEFVTMAIGSAKQVDKEAAKDAGALLEIHAVEAGFPIEGEFETIDGVKRKAELAANEVWLSEEATAALGLSPGASVRLGQADFRVVQVVRTAPGIGRGAFGFAPKAFIAFDSAGATGLLGFGSQSQNRIYIEWASGVTAPKLEAVRETLGDPELFLRSPDDSIQGFERFTGFVSLYLSIVAASLFALGWAAAFYIIRTQASERMRTAAIAMVFGADRRQLLQFEFARILFVVAIAALLALMAAFAGAKLLEPVIAKAFLRNVPGSFHIAASWLDGFGLFAAALLSAILFTLPFAQRLAAAQLNELFADSPLAASDSRLDSLRQRLLSGALIVATLGFLSVWLTRDVIRGLQLAGGFIVAAGLIDFAGRRFFRAVARLFRQAKGRSGSLLRLAGVQLSRARFAVRLSFLAIGLSTFVASAVGQIMVSLSDELGAGGKPESTPDFFLFNIPESDLERLKSKAEVLGGDLGFLSPMILARFTSANGKPIEKEPLSTFPVRITWREAPIASERIVDGAVLPRRFDEKTQARPLISLEARFAERNGLRIGDRLLFDVQGVPIEGEVHNLRRVRWTDFNPNFFISFQAGVLEDAPKTWLANLRLRDQATRAGAQATIVREFPDLSILDVGQVLGTLTGMIRAILQPAEAAAALAAGFAVLVLLAIVGHSTVLRAQEMNLFRILGAEPQRVRWLYRLEFALASGLGSLLGAVLGLLLAWFVSVRFLELGFAMDTSRLLLTIVFGFVLGTSLGEWLYTRVAAGLGIDRRVM